LTEQATGRLRPLISARRIKKRVAELARAISEDHRGAPLTLVIVLKGATVFAADLMRQIATPFVIDFVRAASYGKAARSSGTVVLGDEARLDIAGHHVIVVEDIVDTGLTISALVAALKKLEPASLDVCTLLHKHAAGARPVAIRYKGFDIPAYTSSIWALIRPDPECRLKAFEQYAVVGMPPDRNRVYYLLG
jgi:hypoxanthine phosphoribosyltransferase